MARAISPALGAQIRRTRDRSRDLESPADKIRTSKAKEMPMTNPGDLKVTARGDREIVITRSFDAPRALVWEAYNDPELLKRWLLGPPGWSMVVCEVARNVGAPYHYVWRHQDGREMGMHGEAP